MAKPVTVVDDRIRKIVADMAETMYDAPGVGLAATQVDIHERIIVIDVSEEQNQLMVFINPELVWASPEKKRGAKGAFPYQSFTMRWSALTKSVFEHLIYKASHLKSMRMVCCRYAFNMKWITCLEKYL